MVRTVWVCILNLSLAVILLFVFGVQGANINMLLVALLAAGVLCELFDLRVAAYLNVGVFLFEGLWWVFGYLFSLKELFGFIGPDEIFPFVWWFGIPALAVAAVNFGLYRLSHKTPNPASA